jgi:hypothetical protein
VGHPRFNTDTGQIYLVDITSLLTPSPPKISHLLLKEGSHRMSPILTTSPRTARRSKPPTKKPRTRVSVFSSQRKRPRCFRNVAFIHADNDRILS